MLNRIKSFLAKSKAQTRLERANGFALAGKPFTSALLSRAAQYQDEAIRDLREMGSSVKVPDDTSLAMFAAGAASSIAYHIVIEAAKSQNCNPIFLPYEPVPKYAPLVVAFSLFILAGIYGHLKDEGIDIPFLETAASAAALFYLAHPDDERVANAHRGVQTFQAITRQGTENIQTWCENLMKCIPMYVLQWTSDSPKIKELDFDSLFGRMLGSMLKTVQ